MGLTYKSTGSGVLEKELKIEKKPQYDKLIALGGNPNVGKSTVFNKLTGLNQHTGNWPGKTVELSQGMYSYKNTNFILVDLPGTYSLMANSVEEEIARDFICFSNPDATVIVVDATCIERNLNLVIQTLEITPKVIVCVNLLDEAKRKGITVDLQSLSKLLGVPVVGASAIKSEGMNELKEAILQMAHENVMLKPFQITYEEPIEKAIEIVQKSIDVQTYNKLNSRWLALKLIEGDSKLIDAINKYHTINLTDNNEITEKVNEAALFLSSLGINSDIFRDKIVTQIVLTSEGISRNVVSVKKDNYNEFDRRIDKYITSKKFGIPLMLLLLCLIFWITISGANIPSKIIASVLFALENKLTDFFILIKAPSWLHGLLVKGMYRTLAWVVSVMLPPMAIFFPLFTLLEDLGYLPRVAFNIDNYFKRACACGKQALTMCMGFGCNAAGIVGCRIIDSPRERLIAILTNNFVPCNGRFPTLISILMMFFVGAAVKPLQNLLSALLLTTVIILGVVVTFIVSKFLSNTLLKGMPSTFTLELPPYRKPQIIKTLVRSILDRTIFVLGRAVIVAAPAGLIIWVMANLFIGNSSILTLCANFMDPFARLIGLDGYILMAFMLGFPANEIVFPIIIMSYMSSGNILELESLEQLKSLLITNGWTPLTAICVMLFSLFHWPCATTCLTIRKETQSLKWTLVSFLLPTIIGTLICFLIANLSRIINFIF